MSPARGILPLFERLGGRPKLVEMLRRFYADVRQHAVIGPIFSAQVKDWPPHIEKVADFWSGAMGGPIVYGGVMPAAHYPLGITAEHFEAWLGLWRRHCEMHFAPQEAGEMIRLAEGIAARLQRLIEQNGPRSKQ
jgi:hemoglobin